MNDDLREGPQQLDELEGATPPVFRRVLVGGEEEPASDDATALARALTDRAEIVTVGAAVDLIAVGSEAGGRTGRVRLDRKGRDLLAGAHSPVAVAPSGLAARDDYELRRIDVGIDGSREAAAALTMAAQLARAHDARLRLVAVAELGFDLGGASRPTDPRELERLARHLEHAAEGLPGLRVEAELREGLADQIIVGLAQEADLLVLGSRAAYGDAGRVSLGGIATRILRDAPCATLIVPAP
jgi:nucleotide-binding universal stress UspA family protein